MVCVIHVMEAGKVCCLQTLKEDNGDNMGVAGGLNDDAIYTAHVTCILSKWIWNL